MQGRNLIARKTADGAPIAVLYCGDNETTRIRFAVPRRADGVDLSGLAWRIKIVNAAGATDSFVPTERAFDDAADAVLIDWRPGAAVATAAVGMTQVQLEAVGDADSPPVWQSAVYLLDIRERLEAEPTAAEVKPLTQLQQLIVQVSGELPEIREAGRLAKEAYQHPPVIDDDGSWLVWDGEKENYVDTGKPSQGEGGSDGVSPIVSVQDIDGGHRVTITDAEGEKSFDVMDGKDGAGGSGGTQVQANWEQNDETQPDYVKNRTHYEIPPKFDIRWDGDMTGRFALPIDDLGFPGAYLVKVSDIVLTPEEMIGAKCHHTSDDESVVSTIDEDEILDDYIPGAHLVVGNIAIVYSEEIMNSALGLPPGTITNGVYFVRTDVYIDYFVGPAELKVLDDKFIPESVARISDVESLILGAIGGSY